MGYPKDLDEYTDKQLRIELIRRIKSRSQNKCPYCHTGKNLPCKHPEIHFEQTMDIFDQNSLALASRIAQISGDNKD